MIIVHLYQRTGVTAKAHVEKALPTKYTPVSREREEAEERRW